VPRIGERWAELAADQEPLDRSLATLGTGLVAAFMSTVTYDVVQILQVAGMLRFPADEILILIYLLLADRAVKIVADRGIYSKVWAAPSPVDTAFSLSVPPFRSRLNSDNPM
jgi:hypothetical protein